MRPIRIKGWFILALRSDLRAKLQPGLVNPPSITTWLGGVSPSREDETAPIRTERDSPADSSEDTIRRDGVRRHSRRESNRMPQHRLRGTCPALRDHQRIWLGRTGDWSNKTFGGFSTVTNRAATFFDEKG